MESKAIQNYILLGLSVRYLEDCQTNFPAHGESYILANIDGIIRFFEENNLPVTRRACDDLISFRKKLKKTKKEYKLSVSDVSNLHEIISHIKSTLMAESKGKIVYIVTDKKYAIEKLLNDPSSLLSTGVYSKLPDLAKYDFSNGCRCIAFNLPTSAAFHLMRGIECILRKFYCSNVKTTDRTPDLMWGSMLDHLEIIFKGDSSKKIIFDHLRNIKNSFRNPTQHPDMKYDIDEVQDLLNVSIDVINRITKLIK